MVPSQSTRKHRKMLRYISLTDSLSKSILWFICPLKPNLMVWTPDMRLRLPTNGLFIFPPGQRQGVGPLGQHVNAGFGCTAMGVGHTKSLLD